VGNNKEFNWLIIMTSPLSCVVTFVTSGIISCVISHIHLTITKLVL
jgi:hypothetical protein